MTDLVHASLQSVLNDARVSFGSDQEAAPFLEFLQNRVNAVRAEIAEAPAGFDFRSPILAADEMEALQQFAAPLSEQSPPVPRWMLIHLHHIGLVTPIAEGYTLTPAGRQLLERHGKFLQGAKIAGAASEKVEDSDEDFDAALKQFASLPFDVRDNLVALRPAGAAGLHPCARSHHEAMYLASDVHKVVVDLHRQLRESRQEVEQVRATTPAVVSVTTTPVELDFESTSAQFRETVVSALIDAGAPMTDEDGKVLSVVDQIRWLAGLPSVAEPQSR